MAEFAYSAINAQGVEMTGTMSAPDVGSAREQLQARGLLPRTSSERARGRRRAGRVLAFKKLKPKSLQVFSRQLATMIEAGVSVVAGARRARGPGRRQVSEAGRHRGALRRRVGADPVQARLPGIRRCSTACSSRWWRPASRPAPWTPCSTASRSRSRSETKIKRRVKGAMVYPAVVLCFRNARADVHAALHRAGVPERLLSLGGQLPMPTKIVIARRTRLRAWWFVIFPLIGLRHLHAPPAEEDADRAAELGSRSSSRSR